MSNCKAGDRALSLFSTIFNNIKHILLTSLFSLLFTSLNAATLDDFKTLAKKLDQTEWELVSNEVKARLPSLFFSKQKYISEDDYNLLKKYIDNSQSAIALWEEINAGNYKGLAKSAANKTLTELEAQVKKRFPPDSMMIRVLNLVKSDPELTKKLLKAALDADSTAANKAIREALEAYGKKKYQSLVAEGEKFWKDLISDLIPGNEAAQRFGISPIDLYIQSVKDWKEFTNNTRNRTNRAILDCLFLRYKILERNGSKHQAARDVGYLQLVNFKCGDAIAAQENAGIPLSLSRGAVRQLLNIATTTAALGPYQLKEGEIAKLLLAYDAQTGSGGSGPSFALWLDENLNKVIRKRKDKVRKPLKNEQTAASNTQVDLAEIVLKELQRAMLRRQGKDPDKEEKERKEREQQRMVEIACNAARKDLSQARSAFNQGDFGKARSKLYDAEFPLDQVSRLTPCPEVRKQIAALRQEIKDLQALLAEARQARRVCSVAGLNTMISKLQSHKSGHRLIKSELPHQHRALKAIELLGEGRKLYLANNLGAAEGKLQQAIKASEDTSPNDCLHVIPSAQKGLKNIQIIRADEAKYLSALGRCDMREISNLIKGFKQKNHVFYRQAIPQLEARYKQCGGTVTPVVGENKKRCTAVIRIFNTALRAYKNNELGRALLKLQEAEGKLVAVKGVPACDKLAPRVQKGKSNIAKIRQQIRLTNKAIAACNRKRMKALHGRYKKRSHKAFGVLRARLAKAYKKCAEKVIAKNCENGWTHFEKARGDYQAGSLNAAERKLNAILKIKVVAKKKCTGLAGRVGEAKEKISNLRAAIAKINRAIKSCNIKRMNSQMAQLKSQSHILLRRALTRLQSAQERCKQQVARNNDQSRGNGTGKKNDCPPGRHKDDDGKCSWISQTFGPGNKPGDRSANQSGQSGDSGNQSGNGAIRLQDIQGKWLGRGKLPLKVGKEKVTIGIRLEFNIQNTRAIGKVIYTAPKGKKKFVYPISGDVSSKSLLLRGHGKVEGLRFSFHFKGKPTSANKLKGQGKVNLPEIKCVARVIGEIMGEVAGGALAMFNKKSSSSGQNTPCPFKGYPARWAAEKAL